MPLCTRCGYFYANKVGLTACRYEAKSNIAKAGGSKRVAWKNILLIKKEHSDLIAHGNGTSGHKTVSG